MFRYQMSIKPCWEHYKVPFSILPNELWWCLQVYLFWDWIKWLSLQSLKLMLSLKKKQLPPKQEYLLTVSSGRLNPFKYSKNTEWVKTVNLKWCLCCQNRDKKPLLLMRACFNSCWRPINKTLPHFTALMSIWHWNFACFLLIVKMWIVGGKKQQVGNEMLKLSL